MITTRDIASLVWFAIGVIVLIVFSTRHNSTRKSLHGLWRAATSWKVLVTFGSLFAWVGVCVAIGHAVMLPSLGHLWTWDLSKDTAWIVVFLAIPIIFRIANAKSAASIASPLVRESLGITALLVFYINLEPYPLWIELLLQPAITILAICSATLKSPIARRVITVALSFLLLATAIWVMARLITDAHTIDWTVVSKDFLITLWLPLLLFPFLWLVGFLMAFELAVTRIRSNSRPQSASVAFAVFLGLHLRISLAGRLTFSEQALVNARSFGAAQLGMKEFLARDRQDQEEVRKRQRDLKTNVGIEGTDSLGAQLDRREFEPTKRALDWISAVEHGHFIREGRYSNVTPDDLLQVHDFGLAPPFNFELEASTDRSSWRAWRQTVTGWILGQGGSKSSDEWYFAAKTAPTTWPGDPASEWVNRSEDSERIPGPPDWAVRDGTEDLG